MLKMIEYDIPMLVTKRVYEVDKVYLAILLRSHKHLSNREIAEQMDVPITLAEHWFRTDRYQAIPSPEEWVGLKELLNINDTTLDESINTFEIADGKFEMRERVYDCRGISPTITQSGDTKVLVVND